MTQVEFIEKHNITSSITHLCLNPETNQDDWKVSISYKGKKYTFDYHTGIGHRKNGNPVKPNLKDILYCVASDCQSLDGCLDYESWASDFGYDPDSRKGEAIYRAVQKEASNMQKLLGHSIYLEFIDTTEE